tara:strand:+ start:118 stop:462 length:345 start_codon:yes stop_codon:yes gene_type:complete
VYLTSDDRKFLSREEALIEELKLFENKENKRKENEMDINIHNLISKVLTKKGWALYFEAEPLQSLPIQDGCKMFKINNVNLDDLYEALTHEIENERQSEQWEKNESGNSENSTT